MKRVQLLAALAALSLPVASSAAPVDGRVQEAIVNTAGVHLAERNISASDPLFNATINALKSQINASTIAGSTAPNPAVAESARTWQQTMMGLSDVMPWPTTVGINGKGITIAHKFADGKICWALASTDPNTGVNLGCVASAAQLPTACGTTQNPNAYWCKSEAVNGRHDVKCGDIKWEFDAAGNLIIPSYYLDVGIAIEATGNAFGGGSPYWSYDCGSTWSTRCGLNRYHAAVDMEAIARRGGHLINMKKSADQRDWYGVVGVTPVGTTQCVTFATVAYRNSAGALVNRQQMLECFTPQTSPGHNLPTPNQYEPGHKSCPESGQNGGDFHFYGDADLQGHWHGCTMYYPNPTFGWNGYALNPKTTLLMQAGWPNTLPEHLKHCALDPDFVRKMTEALLKKASQQPGYAGAPAAPVEYDQSRPGDAKVEDLGDNPQTGASPDPGPGQNAPPPAPPPSTGGGGGTDTCDFGTGGCTDPGTAAPSLGDPPTGIMDPIFNWLPDLPSITLNQQNLQCPVWSLDLRDYLGASAQFLMNSHCTLMENNAAAIGALMIGLFGIGAALIVLRA